MNKSQNIKTKVDISINNEFHDWSFGTVNIRSGKERDEGAKIYTVVEAINEAKLSFCCLQEVKYRNSGKKQITLNSGEQYEFHWCGRKKRREAGVGIIVKVDKQIEVVDPDFQDPRIIAMNLKVYGFNLRIVNVYAPTDSGGSQNEKDVFYRAVNKACKSTEKRQKLLVLGDLNAKTSLAYQKCCYDGIKVIPDNDFNDNGSRLKSFCRQNRLCIASTFFDYTLHERATWYSCDKKTTNVNDYVLPDPFIQRFITNCIAKPELDFDSDHKILLTNLSTPMTKKARWTPKQNKTNSPLDIMSLRDTNIKNRFVEAVSTILAKKKYDRKSSSAMSQYIIETLKNAGEKTLSNKRKKRKVNEIWRDDEEFNHILKERRKFQTNSEDYKQLTKNLKKRVNSLRNKKLSDEANEINDHATRRDVENLYRCMKSNGNTFGEVKRKKTCNPDVLKSHFEKHFNPTQQKPDPPEFTFAPDFIEQLQNLPENDLNTSPPDRDEIYKTIMKLKTGKSAIDIPSIYIKSAIACKSFMDEIEKLYGTIWNTRAIPTDWGHSKLVAIWKGSSKGSIENPEAYRALQIGSSLCKILVIIIINRISKWYDKQLLDQQQGFRSGRGTTDGIYRIKRIQQLSKRMRKPIFAIFVDLSAAFDHVDRKWLFHSIKQRFHGNFDLKLIEILETLYAHTTTALAETPKNKFETKCGVRQGGPESPLLYNLLMDYVMRAFMDQCSKNKIHFLNFKYKIPSPACKQDLEIVGTHQLDWIGYADDIVLTFENKTLLQKAIDELDATFTRFGFNINVSKTKTMIINNQIASDEYPSAICKMKGLDIENVKVFRYLGANIKYDEQNTGDEEIELRKESAEAKFHELGRKLQNHKILLTTRTQILNSLVRSRLTYSCQTWTLTEKQKLKMCSMYHLMLRKMVKGGFKRKKDSWSFKYTNDELLKLCKTEGLDVFIERQQKKFLAHMIRMDNDSTTKRLLFNDNPSRSPGREITLLSSVLKAEQNTLAEFTKKALEKRV